MCREQLPVWQQFYEEHRDPGIEILSVAMDAQGADVARPYVEKAGATFTTVVDAENLLGQLYGFKAIPNGYLIDEAGIVRHRVRGGFDIRRPKTAEVVRQWAAGQHIDQPGRGEDPGPRHAEANELFRQGMGLYRNGKIEPAMALWREGVELEPDNYIIRKQVWAIENPEKFYDGDVDFDWQSTQMEQGR